MTGFNFSCWFSAWEWKDLNLEVQLSDDELLEKVWPMVLAMLGRSVTSASFTFRCRIGLTEGFPAILHTKVQTL